MSLYPQPAYGQPHQYGSVGYPQSQRSMPGPSYMQQYPPQPPAQYPPVHHVDPNGFRHHLNARLSELTVNSRPLIISLSQLAQEYSRWSEIFGQCIEAHIRRVPPWMKLPAFYVLDAVAKNVYDPYARTFSAFVIPLFLESYGQVDQSTRSKMEEMLLTWRTGGPTNKELFGVGAQVTMERGIWGGQDQSQVSTSYGPPGQGQGQISKAQVLSELEFTLNAKQRALQANPYDAQAREHHVILSQLRTVVETGMVPQNELRQILDQLRSMQSVAPAPPPPAPAPAPAPVPQQFAPSNFGVHPPNLQNIIPAPAPPAPFPSQAQAPPVAATAPLPNLSALPDPAKLQNLFNSLLKAGVVSNSSTPVGAGSSSMADPPREVDPVREAARDYRRAVLSQKIRLTSADISRQRPALVDLLYKRNTAQCKQCGLRFADTDLGKQQLEAHLDMHFRQNRKASQSSGRGHSRSWFVSIEDWLRDHPADTKGKGVADDTRRLTVKEATAAEAAKRQAELRAMRVVVPPGDEAKPIRCPICKELMPSEFIEDEEEWVWRNAIRKDDKIYHATCHAEAAATAVKLAPRLKAGTESRSRSGTPEKTSMRSTPDRFTSLKRKADDEIPVKVEQGGDRTPPAKRIAMAA